MYLGYLIYTNHLCSYSDSGDDINAANQLPIRCHVNSMWAGPAYKRQLQRGLAIKK